MRSRTFRNRILIGIVLLFAGLCDANNVQGEVYTFEVANGYEGPRYSLRVTLTNHSTIRFCGEKATFFIGCRTDPLELADRDRFKAFLLRIHFEKLDPWYRTRETDTPFFKLCRLRPHRCVSIMAHSELDSELRELDRSMASVLPYQRWLVGTPAAVRQLRSEGYDLNKKSGEDQSTLLIRAARYSAPGVVDELLKDSVDVNYRDKGGFSALMVVTDLEGEVSADKAELLVKAGADVCERDLDGNRTLDRILDLETHLYNPGFAPEVKSVETLLLSAGAGECKGSLR